MAVLGCNGSYSGVLEAANGTIAQALAAAGRGVAVVTDDPRFDLVPLPIRAGAEDLAIRLVAVWDERSVAADYMAGLARRLSAWVAAHYPQDWSARGVSRT